MFRIAGGLVGTVAIVGIMVASPGLVSAASINATPSTVVPGDTVRLSGDILIDGAPGCDVTGTVTLISEAFAGLDEFAGVGAVYLTLDATGHFDSTVTLSASVATGTYSIGGRCGGGNLGVSATIVVGALPPTGPRVAVKPLIAAASTLVAVGLTVLMVTRPRRVRNL
jgi:hypothetical protein